MSFERILNISASCGSLIAFLILIVDRYNSVTISVLNMVKFVFFAILIIAIITFAIYVLKFIYLRLKKQEKLIQICLFSFFLILVSIICLFGGLYLVGIIDLLIGGIFTLAKDIIENL